MSGIFQNGEWYENTDLVCKRCGRPVWESNTPGYLYQCFFCNEDLYEFEVEEQNAYHFPPVKVARPVDGITLNAGLEYLLNDDGTVRVFHSQPEAEGFLLAHGIPAEDLEYFYFVECEKKDGILCD